MRKLLNFSLILFIGTGCTKEAAKDEEGPNPDASNYSAIFEYPENDLMPCDGERLVEPIGVRTCTNGSLIVSPNLCQGLLSTAPKLRQKSKIGKLILSPNIKNGNKHLNCGEGENADDAAKDPANITISCNNLAYADGDSCKLKFKQISAGVDHTCGIASDEWAYCWGSNASPVNLNEKGKLGVGLIDFSANPVRVSRGEVPEGVTLKSISAGYRHTCAVGSDGNAYCWGSSINYVLGNGSGGAGSPYAYPVKVAKGEIPEEVSIKSIHAGANMSCATTSDDWVYCWGYNIFGDNFGASKVYPARIPNGSIPLGKIIKSVSLLSVSSTYSAYYSHACALVGDRGDESSNKAYCWGDNSKNQIGDGVLGNFPSGVSSSYLRSPREVSAGGSLIGKTIKQVEAGVNYSCALTTDGEVHCWGENSGHFATGSYSSNHPLSIRIDTSLISGEQKMKSISLGFAHICATSLDDKYYCWGYNARGEIGTGPSEDMGDPHPAQYKPEKTLRFDYDFNGLASGKGMPVGTKLQQISLGTSHSCAISEVGSVYCWGYNDYGQLGTSTLSAFSIFELTAPHIIDGVD